MIDVVTSYIQFCVDSIVEYKEIKTYPNNKPWFKADLRRVTVEKHTSHGSEDYTDKQRQADRWIRDAKQTHKERVEHLFKANKTKDAWKGLKAITGMAKRNTTPALFSTHGTGDELNNFYSRFDCVDFSNEHQVIRDQLQRLQPWD